MVTKNTRTSYSRLAAKLQDGNAPPLEVISALLTQKFDRLDCGFICAHREAAFTVHIMVLQQRAAHMPGQKGTYGALEVHTAHLGMI